MHISCRHNRLSILLPQLHNSAVDIKDILLALNVLVPVRINQKSVIGSWLNLQIIIKIDDPSQRLLILLIQNGLIQLTHHTGRSHNNSLPQLHQKRLRDFGLLIKVGQMGFADHPVEIGTAGHIFSQKNAVVGAKTADDVRILVPQVIHVLQRSCSLCREHRKELYKYLCRCLRIIHCPVVMRIDNIQKLSNRIEVVGFMPRQHHSGHSDCINGCKRCLQPQLLCLAPDKADIKADIMADQDASLAKFQESGQHIIDCLRRHHHLIRNTGKPCNAEGNGNLRVDKFRKISCALPVLIPDRTNLNDSIPFRGKARGFQVKNHIASICHRILRLSGFQISKGHHLLLIIHKITFHPVDYLKEVLAIQRRKSLRLSLLIRIPQELLHHVIGIRKGLHIPVIGNGNCRPPPFVSPFHEVRALGHAIHVAHLRVHVKLYALVIKAVGAFGFKGRNFHDPNRRGHGNLMLKRILLGEALHLYKISRLQAFHGLIRVHGRREQLHDNGIGKVRQCELQNGFLIADIPALVGHDFTADRNLSHLADDVRD